jgi:hypothetical protein
MITMWIIVGVAVAATLVWRVRKANARLERLLREEPESEPEALRTSDKR